MLMPWCGLKSKTANLLVLVLVVVVVVVSQGRDLHSPIYLHTYAGEKKEEDFCLYHDS
jgi:hypothetical protein